MLEIILFIVFVFIMARGIDHRDSESRKKDDFNKDLEDSIDEINADIKKTKVANTISQIEASLPTPDKNRETFSLTANQKKIKDFLEQRNIKTLIHFTIGKNLNSILENGLLSVESLKR